MEVKPPKIVTIEGKLEAVTSARPFGRVYIVGIRVSGKWLNMIGSIEGINKKLANVEIGDRVRAVCVAEELGQYRIIRVIRIDRKGG